jgi:charged multivesicular body protein 2A
MGSFASKELTPQEQMKMYKREIDRACRELDRERTKLERQQKKVESDIRTAAKLNQVGAVKIMAKDYVRCKKHVQKFYMMRTQLQGVGLQLQTMKSSDAMANAMKNATRVGGLLLLLFQSF